MVAMTAQPIRLCFFGDSFVAGVGDPAHRGWTGLLAERARPALGDIDFTVYNLGVRRDTTADVRVRWFDEARRRFPDGCDNRLVFSFGVNDTTQQGDSTRVLPEESVTNLTAILDEALAWGWPVLVVGPPPVADDRQNARIERLDGLFAEACAVRNVPYRPVFEHLDGDTAWIREAAAGDGAHPSVQGYRDLADIVLDAWVTWIGSVDAVGGFR
ncbi:GDSL-type esterase/lipase family protein [Rhodococcus phenolicus]|uniref:GDSL-type esterase/lipase family protein n=1 Tax=Rhodococcus phenolicus TaxID=263849 RepID=UPI000AD66649|nr:GDSL-type esterase/lipase family protein [Rhodococcus phenolicus]